MILFFDSGIGGLAYMEEFVRRQPSVPVLYVADTAFFPYGERCPDSVRERVVFLFQRICALHPIDAAVLACNTASVVALEAVRARFGFPVVGVVPAVKPAAAATKTGHIAVLSTNNTARDPYTDALVEQFARYCTVKRLGLPRLVLESEKDPCDENRAHIESIIAEDVALRLDPRVDTVVLACTHFVRLRDHFTSVLGKNVSVVDSLDGVVRRLIWTVETYGLERVDRSSEFVPLYLTGAMREDLTCNRYRIRTLEAKDGESAP